MIWSSVVTFNKMLVLLWNVCFAVLISDIRMNYGIWGPYFLCRAGSNYIDNLGFASLTVWNMKTWKAMVCASLYKMFYVYIVLWLFLILDFIKTVLPLGEDPPAITSLCFNHNGKILAASAVDGMIHMFGILNFVHLIVSLVWYT